MSKTGTCSDANFPRDAEGRVYHIGVKRGEVASRILTVGDPLRAKMLATMLDKDHAVFTHVSNRGFHVFTGRYNGVPVSVVAIGMGVAMMDFFVRETRHIIDGPMAVVRLGTCGSPAKHVDIGDIVVASEASAITRRSDAIADLYAAAGDSIGDAARLCYNFSRPVPADATLASSLAGLLAEPIQQAGSGVHQGLDVACDTFYGSQGRQTLFYDGNANLMDTAMEHYQGRVCSFEMETHTLYHLAKVCKLPIATGACAIVLANRNSNTFLPNEKIKERERLCGKACFDALASYALSDTSFDKDPVCVWNPPAPMSVNGSGAD